MIKNSIILFTALLLAAFSLTYSYSLNGRVLNEETGEPLIGANIIVKTSGASDAPDIGASTDLDGYFSFSDIEDKEIELELSMVGYKKKDIRVDLTEQHDDIRLFYLKSTAIRSEPVIVTASRKKQKIQDSPVTVSSIDFDKMLDKNIFKMQDAVAYMSGVAVREYQVSLRNSTGYGRGAGSRVLLMMDGVPILAGDSGEIKWYSIPVQQIKKVEIVKNAASALYGSSAMGGIINIITKAPDSNFTWNISLDAGFYDDPYYKEWEWTDELLYYQGVDIENSFSVGKFGYIFSLGEKSSTGYREAGDFSRGYGLGKFRYDYSDNTTLTSCINIAYEDRANFFEWVDQNNPYEVPKSHEDARVYYTKWHSYLKVDKKIPARRQFYVFKGYYNGGSWNSRLYGRKDDSRHDKIGFDGQVSFYSCNNNSVTAGVDWHFTNVESKMFGDHVGYGGALFAQNEVSVYKPLTLTLGGRFDFASVEGASNWYETTPKLGLVYKLNDFTAFRGSIGKGFRTPTMAELYTSLDYSNVVKVIPNPELLPESALSIELGGNVFLGRLFFDFAVFQNVYDNMIEAQVIDTAERKAQFINLSEARIRGVELALNQQFGLISANLGYVFTEADDLESGEPLMYRPDHSVTASLSFNYWMNNSISVDYVYESQVEQLGYYLNDQRVPKSVVDISHKFVYKNMSLNLRVKNLFEYNYTTIERNMAAPRNYNAKLVLNF